MIKRILTVLAVVLLTTGVLFAFSSCGKNEDPCREEHSFAEEWSADEFDHWHAAACKHERETTKRENHSWDGNNKCTVCAHELPPTELTFEQNSAGTGYVLTGVEGKIKGRNLTIPSEYEGLPVVSIAKEAFAYCGTLQTVVFPEGITELPENLFWECKELREVKLPESLRRIGTCAFYECESLAGLRLPENVEELGEGAFYSCRALASLTVPSKVKKVPAALCYDCPNLESVTLPENLTEIGNRAFSCCTSLAEITIPSSVEVIGSSAFNGCMRISKVIIPAGVKEIGTYAFRACTNLHNVVFEDAENWYISHSEKSKSEDWKKADVTEPGGNGYQLSVIFADYHWRKLITP